MIGVSTQKLVDFALGTRFEDLPEAVVHEVKRSLLDSIGCGLAGSSVDKGRIAVELARRLGGPPESTIIGIRGKVSCTNAGFANGELINALDYDTAIIPGSHLAPYVFPGALALAETENTSGKDLITAMAVGQEVSTRLGSALSGHTKLMKGGMEFAPVYGISYLVIGGVIACGRILGLGPERMAHATGLGGYQAPISYHQKWVKTIPRGMTKYLFAGGITVSAITAALLADMGYTGDTDVFDGDYGFWRMLGSSKWQPDVMLDKLGQTWRLLNTMYKPYPCCTGTHSSLECFMKIINENNLTPGDIDQVKIFTDPYHLILNGSREIKTHVDAQFSLPYVLSVAAHRVKIGAEWQAASTLANPDIFAFMDKVKLEIHPEFKEREVEEGRRRWMAKVEVKSKGRTFVAEKGTRDRMTDEQLIKKFRSNASGILPQNKIEAAIESILRLDKLDGIDSVMNSVRPD